jgi:hypothetical protein
LFRAKLLAACVILPLSCAYAAKLPLLRAFFGKQTFGEGYFAEIITKLNNSGVYTFSPAFRDEKVSAYYSDCNRNICWIKHYDLDENADSIAREIANYRQAVFRYGNLVGYCPQGDSAGLAEKVRLLLVAAGKWQEEKP